MIYRDDKAAAIAAYFLQKAPRRKLNDIKLMKLLYIAERTSLERYSMPIVGDYYASMEHGPVLSRTLRLLRSQESSAIWQDHISGMDLYSTGGDQSVRLQKPLESDKVLRGCEIEILDEVWHRFGGMNKWELKDYCHENFPEYDKRAETLKTSIPLEMQTIFSALGDSEEIANAKVEEIMELAST